MPTRVGGAGVIVICVFAGLHVCRFARAERALNYGIHAVPAPERVTIDGDLSEWDLSGAVTCCKDVEQLLDVESGIVAAMWDREALYVGVTWRDPTPMVNRVDPDTMPGNGWRSDCIQLRSNMAGFVSHFDCWWYSLGKKPAMTVHYGRLGVAGGGQPKVDRSQYPLAEGAEQAFKRSPDGGGYVQEMRIPWALLTLDGKLPAEGTDLRLGLELFWGNVDAESWPKSRVTDNLFEGHTKTDFFWTNVPAWGRLILEKENDLKLPPPAWKRARRAEPRGPVPVTFEVPRRSFVIIALEDERGNRVKSLVGGVEYDAGEHAVHWSGLDDRNEPLPAGRYPWKGLYREGLDVRWRMSFYQPNERLPWTNALGTGAWGPDHGNLLAATAGGGRVYLGGLGAEAGLPLFATDEEGVKVWSGRCGEPDRLAYADGTLYAHTSRSDSNWLRITPRGIMRFEAETGKWLDIPGRDGKPTRRLELLDKSEVAAGLAADSRGVCLSVKGKGIVRSFGRERFERLRDYEVAGAGELFVPGDGRLFALTSRAILELDLGTGETRELARADFATARAITADETAARIYVAMGAPLHQVHVYRRTRDRTFRKDFALGREGGRTRNGPYNPREGFLNPTGLAVDSRGRLWVVENDQRPKRVSVWREGRWQRDFIGDTGYGGGGVVNPLDPTMAFYRDMRFRIDLDSGSWRLEHVGFVIPEGAEVLGMAAGRGDHATGADVDAETMMVCRGRAYVLKCRGPRHVYRELADGRWALCAFIDPRRKLAWMDRNDDCRVQPDEVVRGGAGDDWGGTDYWGMRPSRDFDLYFTRGVERPGIRLRLAGVTPGGTPLWDFTRFEEMAGECMNGIGLGDGTYNSGCAGERGEYFSEMRKAYSAAVTRTSARRTFWFRGLNTGRWTARLPEPGVVLYPFQAHGVAEVPGVGEVVCWVSDFGQRYLFTDDMLYVGMLFKDARSPYANWPDDPERGYVADDMAPGQESFHGYFARLADGRYILTTGFTDCRVFEVTGLDSLRRIEGEARILPEHLSRAREIREFRLGGGKMRGSVTLARAKEPPKLDGDLRGWDRDSALRIAVDAARSAEVMAAWDDSALHVAWEVVDPSPVRNSADDWRLAFKGGDCVDLMFRRPGADLDDAAPREGDCRALLAELGGEVKAVLYRPVSSTKAPHTFDAFEGAGRANAARMDEVRLAPEVKAVVRRGESGYVVQALIPWPFLGGRPGAGDEFRVDFGVLFSDPAGGRTAVRAYWENTDTNIVTDIPSEAALAPARWGVAKLDE